MNKKVVKKENKVTKNISEVSYQKEVGEKGVVGFTLAISSVIITLLAGPLVGLFFSLVGLAFSLIQQKQIKTKFGKWGILWNSIFSGIYLAYIILILTVYL